MQIHIPVIPNEGRLNIPKGMEFTIQNCAAVDVDRNVSRQFIVVNEMAVPNIFQRTIYFKGAKESLRIGMLLVDLQEGLYSLKVDNPMSRPAGLDIQLTLQLTTKEQP